MLQKMYGKVKRNTFKCKTNIPTLNVANLKKKYELNIFRDMFASHRKEIYKEKPEQKMGTFRISNVIKHFPTKCYNNKKKNEKKKIVIMLCNTNLMRTGNVCAIKIVELARQRTI